MKRRNTCCSFCRKSHREVGPLVEGPGEGPGGVYICGECVELCQSIIDQERRRRTHSLSGAPAVPSAEDIQARLDLLVSGQEEATKVLALAGRYHLEHPGQQQPGPGGGRGDPRQVLLVGPPRSSKLLLARALAHVLEVPFAHGDASDLVPDQGEAGDMEPLLYQLLSACEFDVEAARRAVVYVDGVDRPEDQDALSQLWEGVVSEVIRRLRLDVGAILFVCGGAFVGLDEAAARLGRHPEQPITADILTAFGVRPRLAALFPFIARVAPLDEATLARIVPWLDCGGMERGGV
jgi:ATP-dependent Clp protease ATP-binding subunit ClpX